MELELTPLEEAKLLAKGREIAKRDSVIILKSTETKHLIAGYASIKIIDREGERVNLNGLDKAFKRMMAKPSRRNYMLHHSNIQVGELLWEATDSKGFTWKAGVDFKGMLNKKSLTAYNRKPEKGLFVICELFSDTIAGKEVIKDQNSGKLLSFSIGGRVLPGGRYTKCDDEKCWSEIMSLELSEITGCREGVNQGAKAFILKSDDSPLTVGDFLYTDSGSNPYMSSSTLDSLIPIKIKKLKKGMKMEDDMLTDAQALTSAITKLTEILTKPDKVEKTKKETVKVKYIFGKPKRDDFEKEADYFVQLGAYHSFIEKMDADIESTINDEIVDKDSYRRQMRSLMRDGMEKDLAAKKSKETQKADEEEVEEEEEKKKEVEDRYKKPEEKDFAKKEDFEKADAAYNILVEEVKKALAAGTGEVIKKSAKTTDVGDKKFSIKSMMDEAKEHSSISDYLGVE